jgi:hypothetical protein
MAATWETLEFDFSKPATGTAALNLANKYNKISIFFNFGTTGAAAGAKTYYWDDVKFIGGGGSTLKQVGLPITFEDSTTVDYALADFGGNQSSIVKDPTNPANRVGKAIKTATAESWAGTTNGGSGLSSQIPFSAANTKMTVRVWSPDANTPIRLKVEDAANQAISVETEVKTKTAAAWETLEFDFSKQATGTAALNLANKYNKISIFFNFGTTGAAAGAKTYYWDDIRFGSLVGVEFLKAAEGGIKAYPNPANDLFTVEFAEMPTAPVVLTLFDANGKLLRTHNITDNFSSLNVSDLSQGLYFLSIRNDKAIYHERLLIAR